MPITPLPPPPLRSDAPATFIAKADTFLAALATLATELDAAIAAINTQTSGATIRTVFTYDSSAQTGATMTAGNFRMNQVSGSQTSTTQLFIHDTAAGSISAQNFLTLVASSSNTLKGILKISEVATPTDYMYLSVSSATDSGAFWTLGVTVLYSSASPSPLGAVSCNIDFWPAGDKGNPSGDIGNTAITGVKTVAYNGEQLIAINATTIDWTQSALAKVNGNITANYASFTAPNGTNKPCHLQLRIPQGASAFTPTWPASVKQLGATWAAAANKTGIVNFFYDGTYYWMMGINEV
jgi:hypothetical protein